MDWLGNVPLFAMGFCLPDPRRCLHGSSSKDGVQVYGKPKQKLVKEPPLRLWTWLHTLFSCIKCIKLQASWCVDLKGSRWHADIGSLLRLFLVFGRFGVGACCRPCQRWGLFCRTWWPGLLISCITSAKRHSTASSAATRWSDHGYDRMYTFAPAELKITGYIIHIIHIIHSYT